MKKVVNILTVAGFVFFGAIQSTVAQEVAEKTFHQQLKTRFIEGGPEFMGIVLVALILGLAIAKKRKSSVKRTCPSESTYSLNGLHKASLPSA